MKIIDLSQHSNISRHKLRSSISILLCAWDILAVLAAYLCSLTFLDWLMGTGDMLTSHTPPIGGVERLAVFLSLAAILLLIFGNKGHYTRRVPWWGQVPFILKVVLVAFLVDGFLSFSLQRGYPPVVLASNWAFCAAFLIGCRRIALYLSSQFPEWSLPTVLLGDRQTVAQAFHALCADGETGYNIHTILLHDDTTDFDLGVLPRNCRPPQSILDGHDYKRYIVHNPYEFYLIQLDLLPKAERDDLVNLMEVHQIQHALIPSTQRTKVYNVESHFFFGNDFVMQHTRQQESSLVERVCKRSLDIVVSSGAIVVLAILTPFVYMLKRLEGSQTPVFYNGKRVGRHGELFPCWKFCTMRPDGDQVLEELLARDPAARTQWSTYQKLENDPRIDSRISALLRKTSLDELPQLWNVFVGDMSLVGPRPILPDQTHEYGENLRQYMQVRPGLTGLWQVSGRNETTFSQRISWDSWYIRNWSVWNDIVILFKTVRVVFTRSGAY